MMKIAHFFILLPEALPLRDGFELEIRRTLPLEAIDELHASSGDTDAQKLIAHLEISATLKFWHSSEQASHVSAVDQLFRIAQKSFKDLPKGSGISENYELQSDSTVVEIVAPLDEDVENPMSAAFDRGISHVREFQRALFASTRIPLTLITRERLPPLIPCGIRKVGPAKEEGPASLSLFQLNWNIIPLSRGDVLSRLEMENVHHALEAQPGQRVFASFLDLWRQAQNAFRINGDYRATSLFSAVSAEVLLDDLLCHLFWEEGLRPEEASEVFECGLMKRVRTHFHPRLGGSGWDAIQPGPVRDWHRHIAGLRHRVIHAGYEPTLAEARQALASLDELQAFVVSRLTTQRALRGHPRTTMSFVGRDLMKARGWWSRRLKNIQDDPQEPHWVSTFMRWKAAMLRSRRDVWRDDPTPSVDASIVVAVIHPGPEIVWVLHDPAAAMACRANPPTTFNDEQREVLDQLIRELGEASDAFSAAFQGSTASRIADHPWVNEYRLLPLHGVMLKGNDLDPPVL